VLNITRDFVTHWAGEYDKQYADGPDAREERVIRGWLANHCEPKFLNKDCFVRIGRWKTKRQTSAYKSNESALIEEATRLACEATNERLKLHILMVLHGVSVAVASTILHYLYPDTFPIFDFHVRASLKKADLWSKDVGDSSAEAWEEYIKIMRGLSKRVGVSLRDLDKALWAYDKLS